MGAFRSMWQRGLAEYDTMGGIAWLWESADGSNIEAPLAEESIGPNPTDRGKNGTKRHLMVDENGVPLPLVVSGANRQDSVFLDSLLKNRVVAPEQKDTPQKFCLDAAYVGKEDTVRSFHPHIRPRGEKKKLIERDPSQGATMGR